MISNRLKGACASIAVSLTVPRSSDRPREKMAKQEVQPSRWLRLDDGKEDEAAPKDPSCRYGM